MEAVFASDCGASYWLILEGSAVVVSGWQALQNSACLHCQYSWNHLSMQGQLMLTKEWSDWRNLMIWWVFTGFNPNPKP